MATRSAISNIMHKAAAHASRGMLRDFGEVENLQVSRKGPADFVSRVNQNAIKVIKTDLLKARPEWGFKINGVGVSHNQDPTVPFWLIEPLNGVLNFLHGIPIFSISIAVQDQKKVTAGLIFDPVRHEYFFAESGSGAFLNDRRIRVSGRRNMTDAIFSTCTPDFVDNKTSDREYFSKKLENIMLASAGVRVFGSASLDLAYVAAGRYDGFWGQGLNDNAIAAGILIIREAGGFVSDFTSRDLALRSGNIVAANPAIHAKLLKRLSKKEY